MYLCDNYDSTHCLILERQVTKYLGMTVHTLSLFSFHIHKSAKGRFPKITSVVTVYINGRCRGLGWNSDVGVWSPAPLDGTWLGVGSSPRESSLRRGLSGQVLINRTNILMGKEQETDTDAGGRGRPQADGRGRPREEPTRPNPACNPAPDGIDACIFRLGLWGLPGCLGAPTQKTTKASLLSPRGGAGWGGL